MKIVQICLAVILLSTCFGVAFGEVKPNQLFSDHAVLQGGMTLPVWGMADPGETVTVTLSKRKRSTVTGPDGR